MKAMLAQLNPTVGDVPGNEAKAVEAIGRAEREGADLIVFSELTLTGYPPRDLLEDPTLVAANVAALSRIAGRCRNVAAMVGFAKPATESFGPGLEDAAALMIDGEIRQVFVKSLLPNYSVYDDPRYFRAGSGPGSFAFGGKRIGVTICEDLWDATALGRDLYGMDPIGQLAAEGVDLVINVSASGFQRGKIRQREDLIARQAGRCGTPLLYVNQVGGNDEMVFDGNSCAYLPTGELLARATSFQEDLLLVDTEGRASRCEPLADEMARLGEALKLGLRDYVDKGEFGGVILPLASEAGSVCVAALAVEALGADRVEGVACVGSPGGDADVEACRRFGEGLGIKVTRLGIDGLERAAREAIERAGLGGDGNVANMAQRRARGLMLAAVAEGRGRLALTTSDKTDIALGLCSEADAMPGALAPLSDVPKTDVVPLVAWLIGDRGELPAGLVKSSPAICVPGAGELDAGLVDGIITSYVERGLSVDRMVAEGLDKSAVRRVVDRIDRTEHRRRQAPTGLMVSSRAFGGGRRLPVARHYGLRNEHE